MSGSSNAPPRSMSAICQSPVTIRLISRSGASANRSGALEAIVISCACLQAKGPLMQTDPLRSSFPDFCFQRIDIVGAHFANRRHFAIRDLPESERAGDVAILVEGNRANDAFIADWLAVLEQAKRLGKLRLSCVDDFAGFVSDREDSVADGDRILCRRRRDGEA